MMWDAADGMGWWRLWGGLTMVLFWGVIIGFIVWIAQTAGGRRVDGQTPPSPARNPLDIVRQRYAAGEISRAEFDQLREDLEERSRSPSRSGVAEANTPAPSTMR